jgi:hypothetical protein
VVGFVPGAAGLDVVGHADFASSHFVNLLYSMSFGFCVW